MNQQQMQPNTLRQTNAFAMYYALPYGIYWIIGALCFVGSLGHTFLSFVFYFVFASTPVIGYALLKRFRDGACGGVISFGRGYLFCIMLYFYAALLLSVAGYVYFRFFDHGSFIGGYLQMLDSEEAKLTFDQANLKQLMNGGGIDDLKQVLEQMRTLSPVVYAANLLDMNIFFGLLLAVPTALLGMRNARKD